MEQFYFHRHLNGELVEDRKELRFMNEDMPFVGLLHLSGARRMPTPIGLEVSDGSRTRCGGAGEMGHASQATKLSAHDNRKASPGHFSAASDSA